MKPLPTALVSFCACVLLAAGIVLLVPYEWKAATAEIAMLAGTVFTLIPVLHVGWYGLEKTTWKPPEGADAGIASMYMVAQGFFTAAAARFRRWHFWFVLGGMVLIVCASAASVWITIPESPSVP